MILAERLASAHGTASIDGTLYSLPIRKERFRERKATCSRRWLTCTMSAFKGIY